MVALGERLIEICYEQQALFVAFHLTAILGLVCEIDHRLLHSLWPGSPAIATLSASQEAA
jgi:hypothetical protein